MSRQEHDREDILAETTALVERVEIETPNFHSPIVIGFRRDGSASYFFGQDPVIQFNSKGELRRAFWNRQLIKADNGALVVMSRERTEHEVVLRSRMLTEAESAELLQRCEKHLEIVRAAIADGTIRVLRQFPPDRDIFGRIATELKNRPRAITVASSPRAR